VRITRAGDGLSAALDVEPRAYQIGEEVSFVLRGTVTQINHQQKDEDGPIVRTHTVTASGITEVEAELAEKVLNAAAEELERKRAEIAGQTSLADEQAAKERELRDATDSPAQIADAAARRAKGR
jgi:hypothetical protein